MDETFSEEWLEEEAESLEIAEEDKVLEAVGDKIGNLLIEYGYNSIEAIANADDSELLDVSGIGKSALKKIRAMVPVISGVSDQPATVESEVKPVSIEAETAEVEDAEVPSAVEASPAELPPGEIVPIRSLWPARMKLQGPSGTVYEWERGGAQVNVEREDAEFVMGRNRNAGRACCGSSGQRLYFEIA